MSRGPLAPRQADPNEVPSVIDRVIGDLRLLNREWGHASEYAYSPRDRGSRTAFKRLESDVVQGKHVRRGNASDPTGDIVVDQMGARRILRSAAGRVAGLEATVKGIRSDLGGVFTSRDDEDEYEPLRSLAAGEGQKGGHAEAEAIRRKRELVAELERAKAEQQRADARVRELEGEIRRSA